MVHLSRVGTNVVQSLYARRVIFLQLGLTNILDDILIDSPYKQKEEPSIL